MKTPSGELLTTHQAAEHCGISRTHWNHLATLHGISVAQRLPGKTGAKLWNKADADTVQAAIKSEVTQ